MRGARGIRGVALAVQQELVLKAGRPLAPCGLTSACSMVQHLGVARIRSVLRADTATSLRRFILTELESCRAISSNHHFFAPGIYQMRGSPNAARTRWDFRLPFTNYIVWHALRELLFGSKGIGGTFEELLGSSEAELWEVSAAVTSPGAVPQQLHVDTDWTLEPCLFTAFVALQPVDESMGPTRFILGTNATKSSLELMSPELLAEQEARLTLALLELGDAALYDSRVLHAGGSNNSSDWRVLLTVTFRHPAAKQGKVREESRSMLPQLRHLRLRLCDLAMHDPPGDKAGLGA